MGMDIYAQPGTKVIFDNPKNGYAYDQADCRKHLTVGQIYTVERTDVHSAYTDVWLQEVPGVSFNSVMFSDMCEPEPARTEEPQIPCPTCGAMMNRNKLPNCGGSHGSAGHSPECYKRETFEQRMQKELSDAGQIVNRKP